MRELYRTRLSCADPQRVAFHIPFILALPEQFRLHTVLERRATAEHSEAKKAYPDVPFKVVTTLDEVLQDKEIELVVITFVQQLHLRAGR